MLWIDKLLIEGRLKVPISIDKEAQKTWRLSVLVLLLYIILKPSRREGSLSASHCIDLCPILSTSKEAHHLGQTTTCYCSEYPV